MDSSQCLNESLESAATVSVGLSISKSVNSSSANDVQNEKIITSSSSDEHKRLDSGDAHNDPDRGMVSSKQIVITEAPKSHSDDMAQHSDAVDAYRKYASLVVLCVMNASATLMIYYTRSRDDRVPYLATTAVLIQEIFKVCICVAILTAQERSLFRVGHIFMETTVRQPRDCLKVSVPSFVYIVQNNLVFVALTNLDAATFQVLYQLRIITTAIFTVTMLRRSLTRVQWFALCSLFVGLSIVQLQTSNADAKTTEHGHIHNPLVGFACVIVSAILSGFAGVYFEKILKNTAPSIWIRNIQLGSIGIVIAIVYILVKDWHRVTTGGFFVGYDAVVWTTIMLQAISGLTVAAVIKYADNILKTFATAVAIIISCVVSYYFFNFHLTAAFTCGSVIVIGSTFLYNKSHVKPTSDVTVATK